jgi:uncharacterized protein YcbK (DUF882 family)
VLTSFFRTRRRFGSVSGVLGAASVLVIASAATVHRASAHATIGALAARARARLTAQPSLNAFGVSQQLRLRFALPGGRVEFPLEVNGDPAAMTYAWVPVDDSIAIPDSANVPRRVTDSNFVAPTRPGFYHLAVSSGIDRVVLPEPTLAVMVPFAEKKGTRLNGYRIGTYLAERFTGHKDRPAGFLPVRESDLGMHVSTHLTLADFITHDTQSAVWPKYVALDPQLLDKLELVLARVGRNAKLSSTDGDSAEVAFDVHSGFRTPAHNRRVPRSARDSRHQYGEAADVAIDANGDGRVTRTDQVLVARAVDEVEQEHPDLVGGLGLYVSRRYRTPYVHIDVRGTRTRWTG